VLAKQIIDDIKNLSKVRLQMVKSLSKDVSEAYDIG